jgi:SAM-dependent methyltransferase
MGARAKARTLLVLGCGNRVMAAPGPDWRVINHDRRRHRPEVGCVHDLDVRPWPWGDDSVDAIVARAVFEHLKIGLEESMAECWRILRPGGVLTGTMPLWNTPKAHGDPTHRRAISEETMGYFDPATTVGRAALIYGRPAWELVGQSLVGKGSSSLSFKLRPRK